MHLRCGGNPILQDRARRVGRHCLTLSRHLPGSGGLCTGTRVIRSISQQSGRASEEQVAANQSEVKWKSRCVAEWVSSVLFFFLCFFSPICTGCMLLKGTVNPKYLLTVLLMDCKPSASLHRRWQNKAKHNVPQYSHLSIRKTRQSNKTHIVVFRNNILPLRSIFAFGCCGFSLMQT